MSEESYRFECVQECELQPFRAVALCCFAAAVLINLFCNCFSPLFIPEGALDPNCFYTEGCAIANGYLPYRDFLDVKGPLLFLIYTVGYILTPTRCGGILALYILATWGTIVAFYRTAEIFSLKPKEATLAAILATCCVFSRFTAYWGAQPELLLALPFAWLLYYFVAFLKYPSGDYHRPLSWWLGGGGTCTFLIKYNFVLPYVVIFVITLYVMHQRRMGRDIWSFPIHCIVCAVFVCAPFIVYFTYHGLWNDFFYSYFVLNLEANTNQPVLHLENVRTVLRKIAHPSVWLSYIVMLHAIRTAWLRNSTPVDGVVIRLLLPVIAITFLSCFMGPHGYYYIMMAPLAIFLCISLASCKYGKLLTKKQVPFKLITFVPIFVFLINGHCIGFTGWGRDVAEIHKIAKVQEMMTCISSPKIIYYGCPDILLGRKAKALPGTSAWMQLTFVGDKTYAQRDKDIAAGKADFIVTSEGVPPSALDFIKKSGYEIIPEASIEKISLLKNIRIWALPRVCALCRDKNSD